MLVGDAKNGSPTFLFAFGNINVPSSQTLLVAMFAVIFLVTDIKEITLGGCIAEVIPKNLRHCVRHSKY